MTVGPKLRALAQAQWSPYLPRAIHVAHIYVHFVTLLFAIAIAKAKLLAMEALLSSPRALFSVTPTACWPASARRRRRVASPVKAAAAAAEPAGEEKKPPPAAPRRRRETARRLRRRRRRSSRRNLSTRVMNTLCNFAFQL